MNNPKTVSEAFPSRWLKAADLKSPVTVVIKSLQYEPVRNPTTRQEEQKLTIAFQTLSGVETQKRLIPNKTQSYAVAGILNTEVFAQWVGKQVRIQAGMAHNNKPTIVITAPPKQAEPPNPAGRKLGVEAFNAWMWELAKAIPRYRKPNEDLEAGWEPNMYHINQAIEKVKPEGYNGLTTDNAAIIRALVEKRWMEKYTEEYQASLQTEIPETKEEAF